MTATIDELAADVGRRIALETMLFEELGRLARDNSLPARSRRVLATWCHRHAWHAELWRERLPVIPHREVPGPRDLESVESARASITSDASALVDAVLPAMLSEHVGVHRDAVDARLDGPTARILSLVAADLTAEIDELSVALATAP